MPNVKIVFAQNLLIFDIRHLDFCWKLEIGY